MFRRSGPRFADKNMRQTKKARAHSASTGTECALDAPRSLRPPGTADFPTLGFAQPAVGELPDVPVAAQRAEQQQRDRLHVPQGAAIDGDLEPGIEPVTGFRAVEDEMIHRRESAQRTLRRNPPSI